MWLPYVPDTISIIGRDMAVRSRVLRYVERCGKQPPWNEQWPVSLPRIDVLERDFGLGRCDTTVNISEDFGIYEEINRPDIYGYYKTSWEGMHMTLEETRKYVEKHPEFFAHKKHIEKHFDIERINRIERIARRPHVKKEPPDTGQRLPAPVARVTPPWLTWLKR